MTRQPLRDRRRARRMPAASDESGVTLIELMAALVILSLVVLAVLGLLGTLVRASDLANRQTEAEALAIASADYLKGDGFLYGAADCRAGYQAGLTTFQTNYLAPAGYKAALQLEWADAATVAGGSTPTENWTAYARAGDPCLVTGDDSRKAIKATVTVASVDDAVSRAREVVIRCDLIAAQDAGKSC